MAERITVEIMADMLRGAVSEIRANHELLGRLDSVGGDGDHGTTMVRAMGAVEKAVGAAGGGLKALLYDVGWAVLGADGGSTGPLFGMLFMGMSDALGEEEGLDPALLSAAFRSGLASVRAQTKAQPGDKTMIDALVPAVEALCAAAEGGAEAAEMLRLAAEAARAGAEATSAMQARFGRARNIKEQSIGTQDPGATSVSLIFKGFLKGAEQHA